MVNPYSILNPKEVPSNKMFRIVFKNDAKNDFFTREKNSGEFILSNDSKYDLSYSLSQSNGKCSVLIALPQNVKIGTIITFNSIVNSTTNSFEDEFIVRIIKPEQKKTNSSKSNVKKDNVSLSLPEMADIYKSDWNEHGFNEMSVLKIEGNDFYINMDNTYLLKNITNNRDKTDQYKEEYKAMFMMYGLALEHKNSTINKEEEKINIEQATSALAPVVFETSLIVEELRK